MRRALIGGWLAVVSVSALLPAADAGAARTIVQISGPAPLHSAPDGPPLFPGVVATAERGSAWVVRRRGSWLGIPTRYRDHGLLGWVRETPSMRFTQTNLLVRVDISEHRMLVTRAGRMLMVAPVATGAPGTPSPVARTNVSERIPVTPKSSYSPLDYGPMIVALRLWQPRGNPALPFGGLMAFHGGGDDAVGTAASNGCFRMRNADVMRLARFVRAGTPVIIAR